MTAMKIPPDSPTKVGDRVVHRGDTERRVGTVLRFVRQPTWMFIDWSATATGTPPKICHCSELKLAADMPSAKGKL
jgi:hypothetical protein